jgi:hypothetical protein
VIAGERLDDLWSLSRSKLETVVITRGELSELLRAHAAVPGLREDLEHVLAKIDEALGSDAAPEPAVLVDPVIADEEGEAL